MAGDSSQAGNFLIAAAITGTCVMIGYNVFSFISQQGGSTQKKDERFPTFKKTASNKAEPVQEGDSKDSSMKGYKKTADGRTTSYFTRELSDADKAILASTNQGPQRIDGGGAVQLPHESSVTQPIPSTQSVEAGGSEWNFAKTFEEKDISTASKQYLKTQLSKICLKGFQGYNIVVKNVQEIQGDVSCVFSRGKMKFIYDLSVDLTFCMTSIDGHKITSGKCVITDIIADEVADVQIQEVVGSDVDRRKGSAFRRIIGDSLESSEESFFREISLTLQEFLVYLRQTHEKVR